MGVKEVLRPIRNFTDGTEKLATFVVLFLVQYSVAIYGATVLTDFKTVCDIFYWRTKGKGFWLEDLG